MVLQRIVGSVSPKLRLQFQDNDLKLEAKLEYELVMCIKVTDADHTVRILHKSIAGRYRPVRVADRPITARCRFMKNASWAIFYCQSYVPWTYFRLLHMTEGLVFPKNSTVYKLMT